MKKSIKLQKRMWEGAWPKSKKEKKSYKIVIKDIKISPEMKKKKKKKDWVQKKKIWNKKRLVEFWFQLLVVREDEY